MSKDHYPLSERLLDFLGFLVLTVVTLGLYPAYWTIMRSNENNLLLKQIRDELRRLR
ncbi:MAG: DUF4234 domain-containing protein [Chloroflexi bacterium]|nr:DUF4234 domain-containing protein [Chloroflexota bacterium]